MASSGQLSSDAPLEMFVLIYTHSMLKGTGIQMQCRFCAKRQCLRARAFHIALRISRPISTGITFFCLRGIVSSERTNGYEKHRVPSATECVDKCDRWFQISFEKKMHFTPSIGHERACEQIFGRIWENFRTFEPLRNDASRGIMRYRGKERLRDT